MSRPHVDQFDRDALEDHNLVDQDPAGDDPENEFAPGAVAAATEGLQNNYPHH